MILQREREAHKRLWALTHAGMRKFHPNKKTFKKASPLKVREGKKLLGDFLNENMIVL